MSEDDEDDGQRGSLSSSTKKEEEKEELEDSSSLDVFQADPLLPALVRHEQDDYFALGLVVNWPCVSNNNDDDDDNNNNNNNNDPLLKHYKSFCSAVRTQCFPEKEDQDAVMLLPLHSLHITVASLLPAVQLSNKYYLESSSSSVSSLSVSVSEWQFEVLDEWKKILLHASRQKEWPSKPLQLRIVSAQLGTQAGILLWDDISGGIERIRQCLRMAVQSRIGSDRLDVVSRLKIPDIVHTTFVRYRDPPPCRIRPQEAHDILLEKIIKCHPLFQKSVANEKEQQYSKNDSDNVVHVDCAKVVSCKIYLQSIDTEKDHPVYLTLPVGHHA